MQNNISIKDIAKMSGVSIATVSRVINNNAKVAMETRQRIQKIMKDNNYVPNVLAKTMRSNKSSTIGIIVPDITNEFFSQMAKKIQMAFFEKGYASIICNTNEDEKMEIQSLNMLMSQQTGGIIHIVSSNTKKEKDTGIPTIYIDREPSYIEQSQIYTVESDNKQGGFLATQSMINKGCKNIVCFSINQNISSHKKRVEGYLEAINKYSLPNDKDNIIIVDSASEESSYIATKKLLNNKKIDGIFATTDIIAIGVLRALKELNIQVPEQVKVFGYDGSKMADMLKTPLSTVMQPIDKMSGAAVKMLLQLMESHECEKNNVVLPVEVVEKKSTD